MSKPPKTNNNSINKDPMGTVGTAKTSPADEFGDIASGGQNFVARMKAHADLLAQNEAVLAKLNLGKDIDAAKKRAEDVLADAELQSKKAYDVLNDAQAKAKGILDDANKKFAETMDAAQEAKKKVAVDAESIRKAADSYADKVRADIDAARDDMNNRIAAAKAAEASAKTAEASAKASAETNAKETSLAAARAKELQDKIDRLLSVINEVKP